MATEKVLAEKLGAVGRLTFNNPERHNAVSLEMWEAVADVLAEFAAAAEIRVVVVTGAGGKSFVSGADISKFEDERASAEALARYTRATEAAATSLTTIAKPTIAMIDGYCIGGGMAVALSCDLRICSDNSRFAIPAARLGIGYGYAHLRRLVDQVGPAYAKEILFTARHFDAGEALAMGLVNRVVPSAGLEAAVAEVTESIADNAPLTLAAAKIVVGEVLKDADERDLEACDRVVKKCFDSADYVEGRRAFMEKRKPRFTGR
jgi:enoyl-CoA hydratase